MSVGSIGPVLRPYEDCNTFLNTDAGVTWAMVLPEAHKYEVRDQGGIIVAVSDEEIVDFVDRSPKNTVTPLTVFAHPCNWLIHLNINCAGKD